MIKEVEFIVSGEVHGVGYRQYAAKAGRKLKLIGFAENLEDGTVKIQCKGEEKSINDFKKQINVKEPDKAPMVVVENIKETELAQGTIKETIFKEKYSDSNAEMAQGFSTGMNYMNLFRSESNSNFNKMDTNFSKLDNTINSFKSESMTKFDHMDEKYDKISQGMFAVIASMEKRMEKTDKNIESLLKILVQKMG